MKKIITLITIFIISNFIFYKTLYLKFGNDIYEWYFFIPLILFSIFFSWWLASVFMIKKIVRWIFYISFLYFIYKFFPQFLKFYFVIPFFILIIYYELQEVKNSTNKKDIKLSNIKIINSKQTLPNVFITFFKVSFDLALFVRFQFDCITQGKQLNKHQLIKLLKNTNRNELINKISETNKLEKRVFTLNYNLDDTDLGISFEIKDKREFIERDLKKIKLNANVK